MITWPHAIKGIARLLIAMPLCCAALPADADATTAARSLQAKKAAIAEQLAHNAFGLPLVIESTQSSGDLHGDVYAIVDHAFATIDSALASAHPWCDILILHLNVKQCRSAGSGLQMSLGRKHEEPLDKAYRVDFAFRLATREPGYLELQLNAAEGPLGTRDYRIAVEAIALDAGHSFIHMSYAYAYGFSARVAMQGYLGTLGRDKIGFTIVSRRPDGQPVYVENVRGVVERNTMRYYLAIESYLAALSAPPQEREELRLRTWFDATERYPMQLHEVSREDYLTMKRHEIRRQ